MAHLQRAQHIGLKELLIGESMIDQGAIVDHSVQTLRQLLVYVRLQAQVGL